MADIPRRVAMARAMSRDGMPSSPIACQVLPASPFFKRQMVRKGKATHVHGGVPVRAACWITGKTPCSCERDQLQAPVALRTAEDLTPCPARFTMARSTLLRATR